VNIAIACLLAAFGLFKLWLAISATRRLRLHLAGVAGVADPRAGHAAPWMFWAWVGWRWCAGLLAIGCAIWLMR
jgi:hypothetical protein